MKRPRPPRNRPRYVRPRWLKSEQAWGYFFELPSWAREISPDDPRGPCTVEAEALGTDYTAAVRRAEHVLLPQFDSWRTGGLTDMEPDKNRAGTLSWLVRRFKESTAYTGRDRKTQEWYDRNLRLLCDYALQDGSQLGTADLEDIDAGFVDLLYPKLQVVEEEITQEDGSTLVTTRERKAAAAASMAAARRAWRVVRRLEPKMVPAENPFSGMGISRKALKATPTATYEELLAFIVHCDREGLPSLGTAALVMWEWSQRLEHVFTAFQVSHYRPKERPDTVRVVHPKNGEEAWIPLFDERSPNRPPLYPELMERLEAIRSTRIAGLMIVRDWKDEKAGAPLPWVSKSGSLRYMQRIAKEMILGAGLRPELSLSSFRHGGVTETTDSGATEEETRAITRHKTARVLPTYSKITTEKVANAAIKRRALRTSRERLSE